MSFKCMFGIDFGMTKITFISVKITFDVMTTVEIDFRKL